MDGDKTATVLGPTVEIEGEIEGEEDLVIQGRIQGKII
jgi:cytoskeletal protein CcmA (bactofilin family)